ncbi:hypothetical protein [Jiangella asiatica]|uniref:Uncharacterized protein n=1 Tax=Jiangella asiatica TaxID=2530372 RepID=A0A4R5DD11_9ACTN|nr:hypothetical protein [Jiangella asiatica]TDE09721.1 hypothetical protein E1269_13965 [Jiangella asiatica]
MSRHEDPEDYPGGYEDPAQRPRSKAFEHERTDYQDPEERPGRWPPRTLFIAVVVVLITGLAILAILGYVASR